MRQVGSQNRGNVANSDPYRMLSLRAIEQAFEENDMKWFMGSAPLRLNLLCAMAGLEVKAVQDRTQNGRVLTTSFTADRNMDYKVQTKTSRNNALLAYRAAHPDITLQEIAWVFEISKQRVSIIIRRGY